MKRQHALAVLFALIITSSLASLDSFRTTRQMVNEDMDRALAITMQEQQSDVISPDTIRIFNSHLQIAELRGKATLAVDARSRQFKAYARCSEATIFDMSDQRPAAMLWVLTLLWATFAWHRYRQTALNVGAGPVPARMVCGNSYGGLTYSESESRFYTANGEAVQLTPMQHQLLEMFFHSPAHSLTKTEICDALWPKKPDANDTLYTLIRRLKPVVEEHSNLKIESDRGRAYELRVKN
jgi:hypothetical protein